MKFVKSGYMLGTFVPTLEDYIREGTFIQEHATYRIRLQRMFGADELGLEMVLKKCIILVSRVGKEEKSSE